MVPLNEIETPWKESGLPGLASIASKIALAIATIFSSLISKDSSPIVTQVTPAPGRTVANRSSASSII